MCIARDADRHLLSNCVFGIVARGDDLLGMRLQQGDPDLFDEEAMQLLLTRELAEKMYRQLGRILKDRGKPGPVERESATLAGA